MILKLDDQEANILTEILDRLVRTAGIECASACGFFFEKLKAAKLEEVAAQKAAEQKDVV
jgi:hypothetical protein